MKYTYSDLCQLPNHGCFGCCGLNFAKKKEVERDIEQNILDFNYACTLEGFRDRYKNIELKPSGICANLIIKEGKLMCPLHPRRNLGKDLREKHCDTEHLCKAAQLFNEWDDKTKRKFITFLKKKKLDWHAYSIGMDNNKLLEGFLRKL